ncbi:ATP-binding protein [Corynebacterium sp. sy017]|uniref:ATP-binding protein n=1 Tax=unclassified Corynebacterium TaxID=2624378 RepID=UPI0011856616|nr:MULTISPECIES: ATP-binding protein [unclassified Corynebacterium]MBP3088410.1 ATP-binding protein [Corynebacterium sp. sy017]QDZ41849.1 AAA family ATPase [Corynebacterium sp. sy039]TSD91722.1 ATP-binding protein [Corynebacterium sp. SY003]
MTYQPNPFNATLGATPPLLVGRSEIIRDFRFSLDDGPGTHERISLIVGSRGIGKTALLNDFEDEAHQRGWLVLSETATSGFMLRLRNRILRILAKNQKQLTGLSLSILGIGGGINWGTEPLAETTYSLRDALKDLLEYKRNVDVCVNQPPAGVLITLDEMHYQHTNELIDFGVVIQHLVREREEIAVAMAGIPSSIKPLLADRLDDGESINPATFLRRAARIELGRVSDSDVRQGLELPLRGSSVSWSEEALDMAVRACKGYPFMIQLVGQYSFRNKEENCITRVAAQESIAMAKRKLGQLVHEPALSELSNVDKAFLRCMSYDDGPSHISDIAQRMRRSKTYISNYRRRLLDAELIVETERGHIDFALPYLREYVREQDRNRE